jgi:hypothetical protein
MQKLTHLRLCSTAHVGQQADRCSPESGYRRCGEGARSTAWMILREDVPASSQGEGTPASGEGRRARQGDGQEAQINPERGIFINTYGSFCKLLGRDY